jgi:hypothetical protein
MMPLEGRPRDEASWWKSPSHVFHHKLCELMVVRGDLLQDLALASVVGFYGRIQRFIAVAHCFPKFGFDVHPLLAIGRGSRNLASPIMPLTGP